MTEFQINLKNYLIEVKNDASEIVRSYTENPPSNQDESAEHGYAIGQLELAERMLRELLNEE